ncbi:MAG: hypothetical protein OXD40_02200 [bacterium]|nr:hypothetical protein [bacterium]
MDQLIVFGAAHSVHVRAVRLALKWKTVPCRLGAIDVFGDGGTSAGPRHVPSVQAHSRVREGRPGTPLGEPHGIQGIRRIVSTGTTGIASRVWEIADTASRFVSDFLDLLKRNPGGTDT